MGGGQGVGIGGWLGAVAWGLWGGCALAQVVYDGSLGGPMGPVAGPEYRIDAAAGARAGDNLFHSFARFDINPGERANFTGPADIARVIGRITSGAPSTIDGTVAVAIPGADLYLLNPAGLLFGPEARLDVPGAFYATTAQRLFLEDGVFEGHLARGESNLGAGGVTGFGFDGAMVGQITVAGSQLAVPAGETLGVVAGAITVDQGNLIAPGGRIDLVATPGPSQVTPGAGDPTLQGRGGDITIRQRGLEGLPEVDGNPVANADTSGEGGGRISVSAGHLHLDGGLVFADTLGALPGRGVHVLVDDLTLSNGGRLTADTFGSGRGGDIAISAQGRVVVEGFGSSIASRGDGGDGGAIAIQAFAVHLDGGSLSAVGGSGVRAGTIDVVAGQLLLMGGAVISTNSVGLGGGDITLSASESIHIAGRSATGGRRSAVEAITAGPGRGGDIALTAPAVNLEDEALVSSQGLVFATGPAGDIAVVADELSVSDGAELAALSDGTGDAGTIDLQVERLTVTQGQLTTAASRAGGGQIDAQVAEVAVVRDGTLTTTVQGGGDDAGDITLARPVAVVLEGETTIVANAFAGQGGNIRIATETLLAEPMVVVEASSTLGVDGTVVFDTPDDDVAGRLLALAGDFASSPPVASRCGLGAQGSRLVRRGAEAGGNGPLDDLVANALDVPTPSLEAPGLACLDAALLGP
ncbi:MAG: filamentous hemagglutinin N-terminal domain-containing protein [Candidatus Competibacterales bacterium]